MWNLTEMSEESQRIMTFLLLIPVGALITAVFKGVLGLRTIGIFSPTLLALNQVKSDWRIGITVFAVTFAIGSLGRWLLVRAKLSTITRRGIVITVVVMIFVVMVVISENLEMGLTARSVVLPVSIITLMIDRFFTVIDKEGSRVGCLILCNTALVTICCFIVFAYTPVGSLFLRYPFLEFVVLCGLVSLGLYVRKPLMRLPGESSELNT